MIHFWELPFSYRIGDNNSLNRILSLICHHSAISPLPEVCTKYPNPVLFKRTEHSLARTACSSRTELISGFKFLILESDYRETRRDRQRSSKQSPSDFTKGAISFCQLAVLPYTVLPSAILSTRHLRLVCWTSKFDLNGTTKCDQTHTNNCSEFGHT